jgi:hypothetical protein
VPLEVTAELRTQLGHLDTELRLAAEAVGAAIVPTLLELRPRVAEAEGAPTTLDTLHLEGEGDPDGLMLAACLAAHAAYVQKRGQPEGVSTGALAIARLLVWAQRAAVIGHPLEVTWVGPPARAPERTDGSHRVLARCVVSGGDGGGSRRAEAVALVREPA